VSAEALKRAAALAALASVEPGMRLGLGTGSTASEFVRLLGERARSGLDVIGVPTSEATRRLAEAEGVRLTTLNETPELDLTVDGADEIDPALRLIKGGGGALLYEKIVAAASQTMLVVADASKRVERLGRFPLPIEVVPFGLAATRNAIVRAAGSCGCQGPLALRERDARLFITESGHLILDLACGVIPDAQALADALARIPGVVEHGLFIGLAKIAYIAHERGVDRVSPLREANAA
jgi:ribose 5-phosphate isomerase A